MPERPPPVRSPRNPEGPHRDLCPGKTRQEYSVDAVTEPGALKLTGLEVDIRLVSQFGGFAGFTNSPAKRARRPPCRRTIIAVVSRGDAPPKLSRGHPGQDSEWRRL